MFKINTPYALLALTLMLLMYLYINHYHKHREGIASLFANSLFQLNRNLQVLLMKRRNKVLHQEWRPSAISNQDVTNNKAFQILNWISYKYGFGTFLYFIEDYYSKSAVKKSNQKLTELIEDVGDGANHVYLDTIISPSYTSAIAQAIQIPGIAGMENNMVIFEYNKENPVELKRVVENFALVNSGSFDICILGSSSRPMQIKNGIHIWIKSLDTENANLMILLSFILLGHPELKKTTITIFVICEELEIQQVKKEMKQLVLSGRLPITEKNIRIIRQKPDINHKTIINKKSMNAGLTLIGLREEMVKHEKEKHFDGYDSIGTVLFIHSKDQKALE